MGASNTMASNQTLQPDELRLAAWLRDAGPSEENLPRTDEAWVELANDAARAGLAGVVLEHATRTNVELPDVCTKRLRAAAMAVAVSNVNMMRELERVVRTFDRAKVGILLLKGAALNLTVYERPDQRPMSDLDLLVRPASAHHALELLREHGCEPGYDLIRDDFFPKYHYEIELFTGGPRPVRIDLHARPFRPLRVAWTMPADALWHEANAMRIGEAKALIPRPELMILQLAAHAAFHGCSRLLWLYDIKRLVDHYGASIDWALVTRCASRWRLSCAVSYAIERTEELLGSVCPPNVRAALRAHQANWQDRWTLAQAPRDATSPLAHVLCNVLCTPGVRLRAGYLMAYLFPGAKHLATIYPYRHRGWIYCAHLWRMSRAVGKVLALPAYAIAAVAKTVTHRSTRAVAACRAVELRPSSVHGTGVFACREIAPGAIIGRFSGTRTERKSKYVVSLNSRNGKCRRYELAAPFRFLNHSQTPNARFSHTSKKVLAVDRIPRGAEITVDYGAEVRFCESCGYEHLMPRNGSMAAERSAESLHDRRAGRDEFRGATKAVALQPITAY